MNNSTKQTSNDYTVIQERTITLANAARIANVTDSYIRDAVRHQRMRSFQVCGVACCTVDDLMTWRKSVEKDDRQTPVSRKLIDLHHSLSSVGSTTVRIQDYVAFSSIAGIVKSLTKKRGAIKETKQAVKSKPEDFGVWHLSSSKKVYDRKLIAMFIGSTFSANGSTEEDLDNDYWVFKQNLIASSYLVDLTGTSRQNINAVINRGGLKKYSIDGITCVDLTDVQEWRRNIGEQVIERQPVLENNATRVRTTDYVKLFSVPDIVRQYGQNAVSITLVNDTIKESPDDFGAWELSPSRTVYERDLVIAFIVDERDKNKNPLVSNEKAQNVFRLWDEWELKHGGTRNITQIAQEINVHPMTARRYLNQSGRIEVAEHLLVQPAVGY